MSRSVLDEHTFIVPELGPTKSSGLLLALALQLGGAGGSLVGLGSLVQLGFPLAAVAIGLWLLRRRDGSYLEFTLWLWLLSPELRRVVDLGTGWHPVSPIMAVAPVVSCLALLPALAGRRRMRAGGSWLFLIALLSIGYGTLVGALLIGPGPAGAAVLNWLPPVSLGLYLANAGPSTADLRRVLQRVAVTGTLVLGVYGLVQFLVMPAWDAFWMQNAPIDSIGYPEPYKVRVFSTLNSAGPFGTIMAVLLTMLFGSRGARAGVAFGSGLVSLGLSLVRGAWLGFFLSVILLVRRSGGKGLGRLVSIVLIPIVLLVTVGGPVTDVVVSRFTASSQAGSQDQSLTDRISLYQEQTVNVLTEPFGNGLGSIGVATKLGNDGKLTATGNFDSGLLEYPYTLGIVVGAVLLLALISVSLRVWQIARREDDFSAACGAAVVGMVAQLIFVNISVGVAGVFLWVLLGFLLRAPQRQGDGDDGPDLSAERAAPLLRGSRTPRAAGPWRAVPTARGARSSVNSL